MFMKLEHKTVKLNDFLRKHSEIAKSEEAFVWLE